MEKTGESINILEYVTFVYVTCDLGDFAISGGFITDAAFNIQYIQYIVERNEISNDILVRGL